MYQQRTTNTYLNTHSDPLHLQEDGSLEGFLPGGQICGQLYPEGVALAMAHQNAEAQGLAVLLIRRIFEAQVEPRLEPAVLRHPQLQCKTKITVCVRLCREWVLPTRHFTNTSLPWVEERV